MPGIDRATPPEIVARFRHEFDLVQERLGKDFGLSPATVQRYEIRGAPRWMSYALVGWSVVEGRVAPEELRPFWEGRIQLRFRRWPPARNPILRWGQIFASAAPGEVPPDSPGSR